MMCNVCKRDKTSVRRTINLGVLVFRERECQLCGNEMYSIESPMSRQTYSRELKSARKSERD